MRILKSKRMAEQLENAVMSETIPFYITDNQQFTPPYKPTLIWNNTNLRKLHLPCLKYLFRASLITGFIQRFEGTESFLKEPVRPFSSYHIRSGRNIRSPPVPKPVNLNEHKQQKVSSECGDAFATHTIMGAGQLCSYCNNLKFDN